MIADKAKEDLASAMKNKEDLRVSTLRLLLFAIHNKEKEKRYKTSSESDPSLSEEEVIEILRSEIKKRKESISSFQSGGRENMAEKESKELDILRQYLPPEISREELEKETKKAIAETGAEGPKDIGKVMAVIMPKLKGKADGGTVSETVRRMLQ